MIVACELGMTDGAHGPFNAGILATILAAFPDEKVVFVGSPTHVREVQNQLGSTTASSISWNEIDAPGPGLTYRRRLVCDLKVLWSLKGILRRYPHTRLLLTSSYPSTLIAAKLLERTRLKGIRLQAVIHGGLSGVGGRRHRHPVRRLEEMRTALTLFRNSEMQYIVLEESIGQSLVRNLPSLSGKVAVLEHPLAPNEGVPAGEDLSPPIRFGFLGLADEEKGFPSFAKLALEMAREYGGRAEFHAIGRVPAATPIPEMEALATKPGRERLSRAEFTRCVTPLHFVVLPHRPEKYDSSATGTLLDAIAWKKPIVARRIPIFENLFARYGDIGYLFHDDVELRRIVENIVQHADRSRYRSQMCNLHEAHMARTPGKLAAVYRGICDRVQDSRPI